MISRLSTSIKKQFIYLTGWIVACFLHFSCQFLPASLSMADGNKDPVVASSTSDSDASTAQLDINDIKIGGAGFAAKHDQNFLIQCSIFEEGKVCNARNTIDFGYAGRKGEQFRIAILDAFNGGGRLLAGRSGRYAEALTKYIASSDADTPQGLMEDAYKKVDVEASALVEGHCTATVVNIVKAENSNELTLTYAHVGDSQCIVFRPKENRIVFKTEQQKKNFWHPRSLSPLNKECTPAQADRGTFQLQRGDVLVVSTDGIHDNISNEQICDLLKPAVVELRGKILKPAESFAFNILEKAYVASQDKNKKTPFGEGLARAYIKNDPDAVEFLEEYDRDIAFWELPEEKQREILDLKLDPTKVKEAEESEINERISKLRENPFFINNIGENKPDDMTLYVAIIG